VDAITIANRLTKRRPKEETAKNDNPYFVHNSILEGAKGQQT
jgi:hypothetical protein